MDQLLLVVTSERPGKEMIQTLVVQTFPARFLLTGIDREKERAILGCGLLIAGRVADHQDILRREFSLSGEFQMG